MVGCPFRGSGNLYLRFVLIWVGRNLESFVPNEGRNVKKIFRDFTIGYRHEDLNPGEEGLVGVFN